MKKTPLVIASAIVISVSMVFTFAGVRHDESAQDAKVPARIASPALDAVSVQVATLIAPMDMQADILLDEIPLMLSADSLAPEVLPVAQPVVDDSSSGILVAAESAPDNRTGEQTDPNRSVQDALADMLTALDRLSQQAAVTRESVTLLVSQFEE